jgi:hypothetical protein
MPNDLDNLPELPEDDDDLRDGHLSAEDADTMRKLRSDTRAARTHERHFAGLAHEHVKAEHLDPALDAYAKHLASGNMPAAGQEDAHADAFFQKYAADNPEHARPARPPPTSRELKQRTGHRW